MKINPFNPNSPVNPGMFVGRFNEIGHLQRALIQTKNNAPYHFMITGERGIGKTSLLLYIQKLADGTLKINGDNFNFLVLDLDIDSHTTQRGLVNRITNELDRLLGISAPSAKFLKDAWDFISRIKVMDCGLDAKVKEEEVEEVLFDQFATSLANVCENISKETNNGNVFNAKYDGILILIDEADNCHPDLGLGTFLKLLLERLQRKGCNKVLIGLAGLPELKTKLYASHPSSVRIFQELQLGRLSGKEVGNVVDFCLNYANEKNDEKTTITEEAKTLLISLSEGFPHFIQQFGFSAFAIDEDGAIDKNDVENGSYGSGGALEIIGDRYYRHDFYNKIQQDSYRQVLRIMANDLDGWVRLKKIKSKFKGKETTLNNAIKALKDRHIIIPKEGEKGTYRLQHKGFARWIKMYADPDYWKDLIEQLEKYKVSNNEEKSGKEKKDGE